jgi:hypothetical protein
MPRSVAPTVATSIAVQPGVKRTVMPRSLTYWFERGSNSPQSPPMQEPGGGSVVAGLVPPKPPKLVHWFCEKREWMRPLTSMVRDGLAASSISSSVPWPLSPYPSPGTVVKL